MNEIFPQQPGRLPAVTGWKPVSHDGSIGFQRWLAQFLPEAWGFMKGAQHILWFREANHRNAFVKNFGGLAVWLEPKATKTLKGDEALKFMRKATN